MSKELRLDCPVCRTRLAIDVLTSRVVSHQAPAVDAPSARPAVREADWDAAMRRVAGRMKVAEDRFGAALSKEQRRERELDELYARKDRRQPAHDTRSTQAGGDLGHGSVTEAPKWGSSAWVEALQAVQVSAVEDRTLALGNIPDNPWRAETARFGRLLAIRADTGSALFGLRADTLDDLAQATRYLDGVIGMCIADVLPEPDHGEGTVAAELLGHGWTVHGLDPVWVRRIDAPAALPEGAPQVRPIEPGEERLWARTLLEGFELDAALLESQVERWAAEFTGERWTQYLGELDGRPVAAAVAFVDAGVVLMQHASTQPAYRGRGFQAAFLRERLELGRSRGCRVASGGSATFGHSAQAFRSAGFELAFTKLLFRPPRGSQ